MAHYNRVCCGQYLSMLFSPPDLVKVVNMSGRLKSSRHQAAELHFDFPVDSLGNYTTCIIKLYTLICLVLLFVIITGFMLCKLLILLFVFFTGFMVFCMLSILLYTCYN